MPRPGQPQQPQIKRGKGPDALPYGAAARANRLSIPAPADEAEFKPQSPAEQFAFAPTDFPNEPLTAGAPFGPGPNRPLTPLQRQGGSPVIPSDDGLDNLRRNLPLLQQLTTDPNAPSQLKVIVDYLLSTAR